MSRGLPLSVAFVVAAWATVIPVTLRAEEPKAPKVIASFGLSGNPFQPKKEDSGVVIRSVEELVANSSKPDSAKDSAVQKAMEADLLRILKVDAIDWSKQMVLSVKGHPSEKSGGGSITFNTLKIDGKILTVTWKQEDRPTRAIYTPSGLALVDRFEGEVKFAPPAKK